MNACAQQACNKTTCQPSCNASAARSPHAPAHMHHSTCVAAVAPHPSAAAGDGGAHRGFDRVKPRDSPHGRRRHKLLQRATVCCALQQHAARSTAACMPDMSCLPASDKPMAHSCQRAPTATMPVTRSCDCSGCSHPHSPVLGCRGGLCPSRPGCRWLGCCCCSRRLRTGCRRLPGCQRRRRYCSGRSCRLCHCSCCCCRRRRRLCRCSGCRHRRRLGGCGGCSAAGQLASCSYGPGCRRRCC